MYAVTVRSPQGQIKTVGFAGNSRSQIMYTVFELYPDWQVVRVNRDEQWDAK
jgi:hypothetical protein